MNFPYLYKFFHGAQRPHTLGCMLARSQHTCIYACLLVCVAGPQTLTTTDIFTFALWKFCKYFAFRHCTDFIPTHICKYVCERMCVCVIMYTCIYSIHKVFSIICVLFFRLMHCNIYPINAATAEVNWNFTQNFAFSLHKFACLPFENYFAQLNKRYSIST